MTVWRRYSVVVLAVVFLAGARLAWLALTWTPDLGGPAVRPGKGRGGPDIRLRRTTSPAVIPDLYEGYIFSPDRKLDPAAAEAFGGKGGRSAVALDLEKLRYDGSIIAGDLRRALVSFPEKRRDPKSGREVEVRRSLMIEQGGRFRGYLVETVEPLRLVLAMNGERVIKALYDRNKERVIPAVSLEDAAKASGSKAVRPQAVAPVAGQPRRAAKVPAAAGGATAARAPSRPLPRSQRRMQRLRMDFPGIAVPAAGAAPKAMPGR